MEPLQLKSVMRISGLTQRQIWYLDTLRVCPPSLAPANGKGSCRQYTRRDALGLKIAFGLRQLGLKIEIIRKVVEALQAEAAPDDRLFRMTVLTDGNAVLFVEPRELPRVLTGVSRNFLVIPLPSLDWTQND